jgi:hypothetical protein
VLGDAFVAQYFDNEGVLANDNKFFYFSPDEFRRIDFTLADLDLDKPWAVLAIKANEVKVIVPNYVHFMTMIPERAAPSGP